MSRLNKFLQKKLTLYGLTKLLFGSAIFSLPLGTNLLIYQAEWGRGFFNPYTSISFSITEMLLGMSAILFFITVKKQKKEIRTGDKNFFLLLIAAILIWTVSIFISPFIDPTFHILLFAKLTGLLLLYFLVVNKVLKPKNILKIFIISMAFQAVIAVFQFLSQSSLGLSFFGEPTLGEDIANIAKINFWGRELIRGYATFSHPNILGGFLVISLLSSLLFSPKLKHERKILVIIQFAGLLVTFSRSAIMALTISVLIITLWYSHKIKNKKNRMIATGISGLLALEALILFASRSFKFLKDPSITERFEGMKNSIMIFTQNPWGIGFEHYTLFMDEVSQKTLMPWEYQPVHNVFLLILSEIGLLGLIFAISVCVFLLKKLHKKTKKLLSKERLFKKRVFLTIIISVIFISMFDHYFITMGKGRLILIIIFAIISSFSKNPRHVLPVRKEGYLKKILSDR